MDLTQHRERVREVFEHVTGDHEVLALVVEGTQAVGVKIGDDVRHGEGCLTELGKELTIGVGHPSIDIAHVRARVRDGKRGVPGTQLHTISDEIPREERTQRSAIQRLDSDHHPPQCSGGVFVSHRGEDRWRSARARASRARRAADPRHVIR